MAMQQLGCMSGMMIKEAGELCPGLEQLKKEHIPLTQQMEDFFELTQVIEGNDKAATIETLQQLYKQVTSFVTELEPHSEREEGIVFEMVAKYIGRENGPIVVMEYEHNQAKENLKQFMAKVEQMGETATPNEIRSIANHAATAYFILSEHFMKEENVLFPLAEQLLSSQEKQELTKKLN
ncbi:hemerythrin domain-containing protein [Alkalihalobacterium elongatum]|uniref:hemerythrin domain-containing protein n=1 Tax=Alkalihalobacterium elongatum TaxID=2675466 RepID=UPI001F29ADDD|nr:hemerythrin domain-containing protein [Alkalihalobacterium elongatum]